MAKKDSAYEQQYFCAICKNKMNFELKEKYITDGTLVYHFCCYLSMTNKDKIDLLYTQQERVSQNYYNMEELAGKALTKREEAERDINYYNKQLHDIQKELDTIQSELCTLQGIPQNE